MSMSDEKLEEMYVKVVAIHGFMFGDKDNVGCTHEHKILMTSHNETQKLKSQIVKAIIISCVSTGSIVATIIKFFGG